MICEKPLFFTVKECEEIAALADEKGLIVGVTYGFTGHPLVHQMAAMVKKGMLGDIRIVDLQYTHGFNSGDDANASEAQKWRTNPKTSGPTFVLGDIGTHLYYLSEIVLPHMKIEKLLCDRQSFIKSRAPLEDNAYVLSHYDNGAVGRLWVSSVNAGNMGSQRYRFVGSKASVEWSDAHPDQLIYEIQGQPPQIMHHGMPYLEEESLAVERMGALHTEGLGDSWSNIYLWIAQAIDAKKRGDEAFLKDPSLPGHRGRHRGRALARELRAFRRGRLDLGRLQVIALHRRKRHMKLSICTDVMGDLSFTEMLDKCVKLGVEGNRDDRRRLVPRAAFPRGPAPGRQGRAQGRPEGDRGARPGNRRAQLLGEPARSGPNGRASSQGDGRNHPPGRRDRRQDDRDHVRSAGRRPGRQGAELARLHQELARRDARARPIPVGRLRDSPTGRAS